MRRIALSLAVLTLALVSLAPSPAAAFLPMVDMPSAWLQVNGGPVIALTGWINEGGSWRLNFTQETSDYRVSGNVTTDGDPLISYGLAFANNTNGVLPFALGISHSIVSVVNPSTVYASYSGSGTDVTGNGFGITPTAADLDGDGVAEIATNFLNGSTNMGVDVGWGYSDGSGTPGHSNNLGVFSSGPMAGPLGGPWNAMSTVLGFGLTGYQDIATINGYTSIVANPVPEPASLMLLGSGLVGMGMFARRRRKS